jgi:hypothetical protein
MSTGIYPVLPYPASYNFPNYKALLDDFSHVFPLGLLLTDLGFSGLSAIEALKVQDYWHFLRNYQEVPRCNSRGVRRQMFSNVQCTFCIFSGGRGNPKFRTQLIQDTLYICIYICNYMQYVFVNKKTLHIIN